MLDFNVAAKPQRSEKKRKAESTAPPPAAKDPFDISIAREILAPFIDEVKRTLEEAKSLQIIDDETMKLGLEIGQRATKTANMLDKKRKDITDGPRQYVSSVNSIFATCIDPLKEVAKVHINPKAIAYTRKKDLERLESERRAQEEARKLQERLDAESKEKGLPQVEVPLPVLPQKIGPIRTESGSASIRKKLKAELRDINEVPREWLIVNWPKVNQAVDAGVGNIPGFDIKEVESMVYR